MTAPPNEPETDARLGTWLRGKYRLDRVLGEGGMATVYAATHRNKKRFAVKMLQGIAGVRSEMQARFLREGYVANTVDHPGAVAVLDDDVSEDGVPFLVMELLQGKTVEEFVPEDAPLPGLAVTLNIACQVLDTLAAAHAKGIVHRDIKPANLFLTPTGQIKLLDFGIARLRDASSPSSATQTGAMLGTPAFMGPEQALGRTEDIDARTDIWAVGASLFWLITGRQVHLGDTVQHLLVLAATQPAPTLASVWPDVPPPVAALVDRALAFDRADRWATAAAMRDAADAAHRSMFGASSSPAALAGLVSIPSERAYRHPELPGLSPLARALVNETPPREAVSSASAVTSTPLHTIAPVSSSRRHQTDGRARPLTLVAALCGTAVALGAIGWLALRSHAGSSPSASATGIVAVSPSAEPTEAVPAAPPTGAPPAPPPEPQAQPAATVDPKATAAPTPEPRTRPAVVPPTKTPHAAPKPPAANEFDRQ